MNAVAARPKVQSEGLEERKRVAHLLLAERRLNALLFDEERHILSTFELNQIASLSYVDATCDQIFRTFEEVMARPMKVSVLTIQKSLVVAKHVLIYGSEKCVISCQSLSSYVEELCQFNTVLLEQKQQGLGRWWRSIKGGGVDKGFPVREASEKLHALLSDAPLVQQLRNDNADPNSLVPSGGTGKVAFVSDEVRHEMLQRRMKEHTLLHTRSNLVKSVDGFGSGYNASNGQTVVGAAHSLEEMMKRAEREQKKFTETGPVHYKPKPPPPKKVAAPKPVAPAPAAPIDLLDFTAPAPAEPVDLLGFGGAAPAIAPAAIDIFAPAPEVSPSPAATNGDLLGDDLLGGGAALAPAAMNDTSDLLSLMSISAPAATDVNLTMNGAGATTDDSNGLNGLNGAGILDSGMSIMPPAPTPVSEAPMLNAKPSVMGSNEDRFAALDALSPPAPIVTKLSGIEAENRILSFTSSVRTLAIEPAQSFAGPPPLPTQAPPPPPPVVDGMMGGAPMGSMGDVMGGEPMGGGGGMMSGSPMGGVMGGVMGGAPMGSMSSLGIAPPLPAEAPPLPPPSEAPPLSPPFEAPPLPPSYPVPAPIVYDIDPGTTMGMGAKYGNVDDEDDRFVMGGSSGAGLEPMGAMPSAPPPPLPLASYN